MRRVGWAPRTERRTSSFGRFAETPPPGTLRVGCYGDSFTFGAEVADGSDYPALLAAELARRGRTSTEVLNFGVPGYGMHQTAMLHEATASRWHVDRTILLGMWFWPERDGGFVSMWAPAGTPRARYIVDGDRIRLVDAVGDTDAERFAAYHRFLTPLRYLRFDRHPPAFVRGLLPAGRTIPNPFYYRSDGLESEAREIYPRLLRQMATERPLDVVHSGGVFQSLGTPGARIRFTAVTLPATFPYLAPRGHLSPWGNRWLASRIADALLGDAPSPPPLILTAPAGHPPGAEDPLPVGSLTDLRVLLGELPAGGFASREPGDRPRRIDHLSRMTHWLVALSTDAAMPLPDAVFVPIDGAHLPPASLRHDGRRDELPGPVAIGQTVALARLDLCTAALRAALQMAPDTPCSMTTPRRARWAPRATIALGEDTTVDVGVTDDLAIVLRPARAHLLVRAYGDAVPTEQPAGHGAVWLAGRDERGDERRERLAGWQSAAPATP